MPYYCMPVLHAVLLLLHLQYAMTDDSGVSDNSLHLSPPDSQHASHDTTTAFSCYTCNVRPGDDDTEQCVDEVGATKNIRFINSQSSDSQYTVFVERSPICKCHDSQKYFQYAVPLISPICIFFFHNLRFAIP